MPRLIDIRFDRANKLANRVVQSQRLYDLMPPEELDPLVATYEAAQLLAESAAAVTYAVDDISAEVHEDLRAGNAVDAAAVIQRFAQQHSARTAYEEGKAFLGRLPNGYKQDIVNLINKSRSTLWTGVAAQLPDVLDRGEAIVASLDGALDADAAITAGKADEWTALRTIAEEYADIRAAHLDLLRSDADDLGIADDVIARAFFEKIDEAWPTYQQFVRHGTHQGGFRVSDGEPWPLVDYTSREHFIGVVQSRDALHPFVGALHQAKAARAAALRAREPSSHPDRPGQGEAVMGSRIAAARRMA